MFIWQGSDFTDILPREFVRQSSISWWGSVQYVIILSSNQVPPYSNKNSISSYRIEASVQKLTKCYCESNLPFFAEPLNTPALGSHEFRNEDHCFADFHLLVWIEWCEKRWALAGLIHFSFYSIGCKCYEKTNSLLRRNFIDSHTHCTGIFERRFFLLPSEPQQKGSQSLIYRFTKCKN